MIRNSVLQLGLAISLALTVGCATTPNTKSSATNSGPTVSAYDPAAAEKSRPYIEGHHIVDLRFSTSKVGCVEPSEESTWKDWIEASSQCVQKNDWGKVEKLATEMARRDYNSPWGAYFLGMAAAARGELARAYWMFELSEKKAGGALGLVRFERARILEKEEGALAASRDMKEAVRLEPELLPGWMWLAQVYHRDHLLAEAETYYREALKVKPDHYAALIGMADIQIEKKDGPSAVDFLSKAVTLRPEIAETRSRLAMVYESILKDTPKALETYRELKVAIEKGRSKGKVAMDLNSKIRTLEKALKAEPSSQAKGREPAQKKGG